MFGSVQERIDLRKKLQCQTFSWYIDKVYPEMYIEGTGRYIGQVDALRLVCFSYSPLLFILHVNSFTPILMLTENIIGILNITLKYFK